MSYASLVKTLPGTWRSSTSLAALASLGIHGLLFAVLPVLPFESKSLDSQSRRTVGLIELTPNEQSRLPQVSTSQVTLPPFAMQPSVLPPLPPPPPFQLGVLPPLPPPSSQIAVLPPLPALPQSFQLPLNNRSVSNNSLRASSPQTQTFRVPPPAPTQNNRSVPSRIAINNPPGVLNQPLQSNELLPPPRRWTPPRVSGLPPTNGLTAQRFDPANFPPSPPIVPVPSPPPIVQENNNPAQNITPSQDQKVATANQQAPSTPAVLPQRVPERTKRELLARRDQLARANRAASPAIPAPGNTSGRGREQLEAALQQRLRSQPQRNPAGSESETTARAIRQVEEYKAQYQRVQEDHPKVETKAPVRQKITTCEKQLDSSVAYINAVVNPQGKIVSGPVLYSKTGTVDIQQAIARVRNYSFQATSDTTNYNFAIKFKYDTGNCSESTPEPSPENTQTQQSKL